MERDPTRAPAILRRGLARLVVPCALIAAAGARADDRMALPGRDWEKATPESRGVDPTRLAEAIAYLEGRAGPDGVKELVVVRDGWLIWEGTDAGKVHGVWSCTKSFTSTALGLLIDDGKCRLDSPASEFLPDLAGSYPGVTLRHFASMTSGYRALGDEPRGGYTHGPSPTPFRPDPTPLFAPPGSRYAYWDSAMNQFANVLTRIAGEPLEELFRRRIAGPIGMDSGRWDWGDFGAIDGPVVNGGAGNHDKHVRISARELARLGHLFLNRGRWGERRIMSESWVDAVTTVQVPASLPLGHGASGIDGRGVYGLNWWVNGVGPEGRRKWPGAPLGTFAASGYNNNDLFVVPEWRMVVVRLGLDQARHEITDAEYGTFLEMIGRAIDETGRPGPSRRAGAAVEGTTLGIRDTRFTLDGEPAFLLGISYYAGLGASDETLRSDLDDLERHGFNWLRVWATWAAFGRDVSAVDAAGRPREPFLGRLERLVAECDRRGLVVDVTLTRGDGTNGGAIPNLQAHRRAVETLLGALKAHRNWYLDLANERDVRDARHVPAEELKALRNQVRALDPERLVTASFGGHDLDHSDLQEALLTIGIDFVCPHRPREADSPGQSEARTRASLAAMKAIDRPVPVHYQEPFRRGYGGWEPSASDFLADLRGAVAGGAAGWCFHNGSSRGAAEGHSRRSFDLHARRLFDQLDEEEREVVARAGQEVRRAVGAQGAPAGRTAAPALRVSDDGRHLVRDRETPFFWLGDTAWLLVQMTSRDDAELYLRTRAEQGFTVIQAAVVMGEECVGGTLRPNRYGDLAFQGGDPARPAVTDGDSPDDDAAYDYWDHADYLVDRARAHGLTLALLPLFVGSRGDGFKYLTPENAEAYGRFLGGRYRDRPHVLWVLGGDNTPDTDAKRAVWARLARGITIGAAGAEDYGRTLMTYHINGQNSSSQWFHEAPWLDFNMIQVWGDEKGIYPKVAADRRRAPAKPTGLGEGSYEDGPQYPTRPIDALKVRRQAYWSYLAGGYHTYGDTNTWNFGSYMQEGTQDWKEALRSPGAASLTVLAKLLASLEWWRLVPEQSVFAEGAGDGESRNVAMRSVDGGRILAYLPGPGTVRLDLRKTAGADTAHATWIDPRSGARTPPEAMPAAGVLPFSTPEGWPDALLLIEARR